MAVNRLAPDVLVTQTDLVGSITAIQDDPDSPDGNWLTAVTGNTTTVCEVSFPDAANNLTTGAGLQEFRLWLRRTNNSANAPTFTVELYEGATLRSTLASGVALSSTTGQLFSYTWDASSLGSQLPTADVRVRVTTPSTGGTPSSRNTGEIGAIEWNADTSVPGITGTLAATEVGQDTASASGELLISGTVAATDGQDTASMSGEVLISGTVAATDGQDTASIIGTAPPPPIEGTLAATDGQDTASISAELIIAGSLSATEAGQDTASMSGEVLISGAIDATDGQDTASFIGQPQEPEFFDISLCDYSFKREAKLYVVDAGSKYQIDISDVTFSQTFTETSYSVKTIQDKKLFEASIINKANPANFSIRFPALREADLRILFDKLLNCTTFDLYIETKQDVFKLEYCVIGSGSFVLEKTLPLTMAISGEASKLTRFGNYGIVIPGIEVPRSANRTYNRISDLSIILDGIDISQLNVSVGIELQNNITWIPWTTVDGAIEASQNNGAMYPTQFVVNKKTLSGDFTQYLIKDNDDNLQNWSKDSTLDITAGQLDGVFYGFELNLANCSYKNELKTDAIFTQNYTWRLTQNPPNLSDIINYNVFV